MEKDLFTYEFLDDCSSEYLSFGKIKMLRDFGSIKKDSEWDFVTIQFSESEIHFINENDSRSPYIENFTLQPKQ